jgi:eukaryotic-like serine/threonine-protein kinase
VISIVAVGRARAARKLEACEASGDRVRVLWRDKREPIHRAFAATKTSFAATTFDAVARMYDAYVPALASRVTAACHSPPEDEPASITDARRRCLDKRAAELAAQLDDFARANAETVRQAVDGAWAMVEPACDDVRVLAFGPAAEPAMADDLRERGKRGRELNRTRKYDEGVRLTESLIADARKRGDRTAEIQALHLLGDLRTNLDQLDAAIDAYQQGLRVAETQSNDLDATKMLAMLAERHGDKNDPATAHRMVALARAKLERIGGENAALTAYLHRIDGHIFEIEDHCPEAQAELRKAIAAFEHAYGPDHPNVGMTLSELSKLECSHGADALASATRALTIIERSYGPDHPNVGGALQNLAIALADAGRFDDAHKHLVRADAIFTAALGSAAPFRIALLVQLGDVAGKRGDRDGELSSYRQAAALIEAAAGADSPQASAIHARIGEALLRHARPADALRELERAVALAERGNDRDAVAEYRALLARARAATHR